MEVYQIWILVGIVCLIVEMFTPALFFLSLAIGAFVAAVSAFAGLDTLYQYISFLVGAVLMIFFARPMLMKQKSDAPKTGVEEKYIGNSAIVIEKVTTNSGRIKIYGEEWQARTLTEEEIEVDSKVLIKKNESLIMFVEKN